MSYAIETKEAVYFFEIKADEALVSKLVRKGQKGQDQKARCSVAMARHWYKQLLNKWSVKAGPGVQSPWHFLPTAEMGTAQLNATHA